MTKNSVQLDRGAISQACDGSLRIAKVNEKSLFYFNYFCMVTVLLSTIKILSTIINYRAVSVISFSQIVPCEGSQNGYVQLFLPVGAAIEWVNDFSI